MVSVLKKGDRHLTITDFRGVRPVGSEPLPLFQQAASRLGLWGLLILWLLNGPWAVAAEPAEAPAASVTIRIGIQPYTDDGLLKGAERERYRQLCEEIAINARDKYHQPIRLRVAARLVRRRLLLVRAGHDRHGDRYGRRLFAAAGTSRRTAGPTSAR